MFQSPPDPLETRPQEFVSARGRWVSLRPISRDDVPTLFKWHSDLSNLHLWSSDRRLYSAENFNSGYPNFVSGAIVVLISDSAGLPIGFIRAFDLNFSDGWLKLTVVVNDVANRRLEALEATALFIDYMFSSFPLRKIYSGVPEYDVDTLAFLERAGFVREGRDVDYIWHGDKFWDVVQLSLFRSAWDETRKELLRLADLAVDLNSALDGDGRHEVRLSV